MSDKIGYAIRVDYGYISKYRYKTVSEPLSRAYIWKTEKGAKKALENAPTSFPKLGPSFALTKVNIDTGEIQL